MRSKLILSFLISLMIASNVSAQFSLENAFPNLSFNDPLDLQNSGDGTDRIFVVERAGRIKVFPNSSSVTSLNTFLDITDRVSGGGEMGLLGLAFHPDYANSGFFYVNYTNNSGDTRVDRFTVNNTNPNIADPASQVNLLAIDQPFGNHNAGDLAFGPDGFLYVAFGDGGSGGDPKNHGQNLKTILASIIRINIDSTSNNKNYSIPQDNPFVNNTDSLKEEIFAYGLRNVWRFSFDQTGNIWAADVGQNAWEEIHLIESGKNYGWRIMEGMHCFEPSTNCNREGLELPIWEYGHNSEGGYSITGGYVSQDINVPDILNKYIYADYVTGNIWAFDPSNSSTPNSLIKKVSQNISTFGIDENKTLYFADLTSGKIYKFIDNSVNSVGSITPSNFELLQNYPNPFNPSTNIKYTIPVETTHKLSLPVQLKIYDLLGKNIATLVEQNKTSGNYTIEFDASSLTSGIYFYRIIAGNFISTKKMILQK